MKNDENEKDRNELRKYAKIIRDNLKRCTTLDGFKGGRLRSAESNGWYIDILKLNKKLVIELFFDHMVDEAKRGFWIGFTSSDKGKIEKIVKDKPKSIKVQYLVDNFPDKSKAVKEYYDNEKEYYFGIYFEPGPKMDVGRALTFVCDVLQTIREFKNSVTLGSVELDIAAIKGDPTLNGNDTVRKQLIDARIGQGDYRRKLEEEWDSKCAVLGIANRQVLRASHVKPWRSSNNDERLDKNNGLLLSAHIDALFDAGLISFTPEGELLIANTLAQSDRDALCLGAGLRKKPSPELAAYLKFHQSSSFKGSSPVDG